MMKYVLHKRKRFLKYLTKTTGGHKKANAFTKKVNAVASFVVFLFCRGILYRYIVNYRFLT